VTQNFKDIDMENGKFQQLPGDQQQAGLDAHIDKMRNMVAGGSANMTVNQKMMYDRQTLWNLRAQISRAVTSADSAYHGFAKNQLVASIENTMDHAIRNIDNDAIWHLDQESMSKSFAKLAIMDHVSPELMEFNLRKTYDNMAGKSIRAILADPKHDINRAQQILNDLTPHMSGAVVPAMQTLINKQRLQIDMRQWGRDAANQEEPPIGGSNTTGIVVMPSTPPTEPIPPAAPVEAKPEIRSEIDPAQDALNRGDYMAYTRELYAPHAPRVQLASLPKEMRDLPTRGGADVTSAIDEASGTYGLDASTMRAIASIESSNNPSSNRSAATQYKGLFQLGRDEWRRYGEGDIYNPRDNAMAAARMLADHQTWFRERYGRNPSDSELYMMHQQGRGFFTRGAMTNIAGNRYPGMRGPQNHASFQAGWASELARRKMLLARSDTVGA
jgi:hypothetical protein